MAGGERIFLTGITGSVGAWLAAEALRRGRRVTALVRGDGPQAARRRVDAVLSVAGAADLADRVDIVVGDLESDDLGIDVDDAAVSTAARVIHSAGCTEFRDTAAELLWRTNVEGTDRVLALAEALGVPLVHVSTAYVAGRRSGVACEDDLDPCGPFNNAYEQSKAEAEMRVHRWQRRTRLPTTVLRPSIVLGDAARGHAVGFNTVYHIMRAFGVIAPDAGDAELRVVADSAATKNFVPVDYFSRMAWQLINRGASGTFHLTHPEPIRLGRLRDVFAELFHMPGIRLVPPADFDRHSATDLERLYQDAAAAYLPYMLSEPCFDRTHVDRALAGSIPAAPELGVAYFQRLLTYARARRWRRPQDGSRSRPAAGEHALVERYFSEFLAGKMRRLLLPDLHSLTATFAIVLRGVPRGRWVLAVDAGRLIDVSRNGRDAACTFVTAPAAFMQIVGGRLSPQQAFFDQQVDIEGDVETGLRTATVLAAFFRQFPFVGGTDPA